MLLVKQFVRRLRNAHCDTIKPKLTETVILQLGENHLGWGLFQKRFDEFLGLCYNTQTLKGLCAVEWDLATVKSFMLGDSIRNIRTGEYIGETSIGPELDKLLMAEKMLREVVSRSGLKGEVKHVRADGPLWTDTVEFDAMSICLMPDNTLAVGATVHNPGVWRYKDGSGEPPSEDLAELGCFKYPWQAVDKLILAYMEDLVKNACDDVSMAEMPEDDWETAAIV